MMSAKRCVKCSMPIAVYGFQPGKMRCDKCANNEPKAPAPMPPKRGV